MQGPNKVKQMPAFTGTHHDPSHTKMFGIFSKRRKSLFQPSTPHYWFFKCCPPKSFDKISQLSPEDARKIELSPKIEAAIADIYGWMMGRSFFPKVRPVVEAGKTVWVASKEIQSEMLERGTEPYKANRPYSAKALCTTKNARSLAAAYFSSYILEEYDLSWTNLRVSPKGDYIRIDSGSSLWSITCQYKYDPIENTYVSTKPDEEKYYYDNVKPAEAIPISTDILRDLPNLSFGTHGYKPYNTVNIVFENDEAKAEFTRQKWKYCLKALLLNQAILKSSADQFLAEACPAKTQLLAHVSGRLQALRVCLLSITEFNECVTQNSDAFKAELFEEFKQYNSLKKSKDPTKFKSMASIIGPVWDRLIGECRSKLILSSQPSRKILTQALSIFLESEIRCLNPSPYRNPVRHEKITALKAQKERLQTLVAGSANQQVQTVCDVVRRLDAIAAVPMGCIESLSGSATERRWRSFKTSQMTWIQAFNDANNSLGNAYGASISGLGSAQRVTDGTPLLAAAS